MSSGRHVDHRPRTRTGRRISTASLLGLMLALGALGTMLYGPTLALGALGIAESGNLVITKPGTVVDGQIVRGYLHIKADNVRVKNTEVRYAGAHSIRIFDGADGTVIEDSVVRCGADRTNGLVFGNYTAVRVHVYGCRRGFMYSATAPATIVDSYWNGKPVRAGDPVGEQPAPSPSPTPTPGGSHTAPGPSPSSTPGGTPPTYAGWPNASNTGVPSGKSLKSSGSLTITTAGRVIDGLNINGCVDVKADNVVIRNSRISCDRTTFAIRTWDGASNLLVEDSEIDGEDKVSAALCCGHYTLRRVEIRNVEDGPRLASKTRVYDSWIHDLSRLPGSHNDALQTTGAEDIIVRHNTLEAYNTSTNDPMNAAIMLGSTTGPAVRNMLVEHNLFTGGNYTINFRPDITCSNVVFRNNTFVDNARYGPVAGHSASGVTWAASNVWKHNGQPVA
ncbi:MAG: right-handed parallel beta-helix repeat-containing protein [Micromonosporaceae bacterium]